MNTSNNETNKLTAKDKRLIKTAIESKIILIRELEIETPKTIAAIDAFEKVLKKVSE